MATQTPITELDFESIKTQLKTYLKGQTQFKDYNFEGSNMSVLLDVLSYNTFQNNFYTNMAINEMFLDSAVLRNSIMSHAKELNYLPRSRRSAKAVVKVRFVDTDNVLQGQTVTVPQYTDFVSSYQGVNYNFVNMQTYVARKIGIGVYETDEIELFEGEMLTSFEREGFIVDADGILRVALTNENADTDSFEVFVDAEATDNENIYIRRNDIFGVEPNDKVFYVEPYFDNRYSIYFGGNVFGNQPSEFEDVRVRYRVTSGAEANGASSFNTSFLSNVTTVVSTISPASGGLERESTESIRNFAPKALQIQERAITERDYEVLLKQKFPEITSVSAYGGEELDPPQFGKVALAVYLRDGGDLLSSSLANQYVEYLQDKTPLSIEPIFVQTEFIYACVTVKLYYSRKLTTKSADELETLVRGAIQEYSNENLNNFDVKMRLSKLTETINNLDVSIQSNFVDATPKIEWSPAANISYTPTFRFQAELVRPYPYKSTNGFTNYKPAIRSSAFKLKGGESVYLQDDGLGKIQVITDSATQPQVVNVDVGSIDYDKGELTLVNFAVESYEGSAIEFEANTKRRDISAPTGRVFFIRDDDVTVEIIAEEDVERTAAASSVATAGGSVITTY